MKLVCPSCESSFLVDASAIGPSGRKVRCGRCGGSWLALPETAGQDEAQAPDEPVPAGVDYDMWLGPAPKRPFNRNRFHFNFRWFWDYAGGLMTDWGVHLIDMVLMGMDATAPHSVMSAGGMFAYPDSAMETPDTQQAIFEFDSFTMVLAFSDKHREYQIIRFQVILAHQAP